ncbi:MAG: cupin domain-containing protein [Gammaproteobacteria bacterium]
MTKPGPVLHPEDGDEYWFEEGCHILELLNDPEDPHLSIARARVPAGATTRWHRLAGTTERYLVLSGRGEAWVGDAGPLPVGPGDLVLIPPGARQRVRATGPEELVFLAICTPRFRRENYSGT